MSHSLGKATVTLNKPHIVLPSIENILHFSEESLLQSDTVQPLTLQHLDGIVEGETSRSHTRGTDMIKITNTLRGEDKYQQSTPWLRIIGTTIMFLGLGILWFVRSKSTNKYCPYLWKCTLRPKQPPMMTAAQALNACDKGLQVTLRDKETMRAVLGTSPEEASGSQVLPIEFVLHGRMVADHL